MVVAQSLTPQSQYVFNVIIGWEREGLHFLSKVEHAFKKFDPL